MAKNDNLQDFLIDIANAIRNKKGTTDLINPQDFSSEIESISGGAVGEDSKFVQLVNGTLESVTEEDLKDITSIRDGVFSDLSIKNVEIPSNVTTIGNSAFANNKISEVTIADGVVTMGDSAFANNQISTITIPQSVTAIGDSAFATNPLTEITMESEIPPQIGETTFPSTVESVYVKYGAYDSYYAKWTINLFNNKMESGDIAHGTGIDQSSSERVRTIGYIPVEPNTTYVFTRSSSTGAIGVRNYTSSKTFISSFSPMAGGISSAEFTTDANTYYIRFIQETTDINVKYEIYSMSGGIKGKLVRLPAIPSSITVIVNNYLNELMQGVTVTIEGNGQTFTGTTNENGVFTQGDLQPATYTVSVADVDEFKQPSAVEIVVEENTQNSTTFTYLEQPAFSRIFGENTPETISQISSEISANNMTSSQVSETYGWNIGDTIDINLTTGEAIQMRIIGFNHDDKSDGSGKAGITLEMVNCLNTTYKLINVTKPVSFSYSTFNTTDLPNIESTLPEKWKNSIKTVTKNSGGYGQYGIELNKSEQKLFLLSLYELGITNYTVSSTSTHYRQTNYLSDEGSPYEYWKNKAQSDRIKNINGVADRWYTRSTQSSQPKSGTSSQRVWSTYFIFLQATGEIGGGGTGQFGVSLAFCV